MQRCLFSFMMLLTIFLLSACSDTDLTEQQVYEVLKKESVIARHPFFELKEVSIQSSSWEDNNFKAVLKITFLCNQGKTQWTRENEKDFIPTGTALEKGTNSIKATATFMNYYADDGAWHLKEFSF